MVAIFSLQHSLDNPFPAPEAFVELIRINNVDSGILHRMNFSPLVLLKCCRVRDRVNVFLGSDLPGLVEVSVVLGDVGQERLVPEVLRNHSLAPG